MNKPFLIIGTISLAIISTIGALVIPEDTPAQAVDTPPGNTATRDVVPPKDTLSPQLSAAMIESANAAQEFVKLLDEGKYSQSWSQGSSIFQKTIGQAEWTQALNLARKPLGKVKARTVKKQLPAWDPEGLPKGAYMVVEYNTSFENAPNSGELLTLMQERNGTWKVLTYQVN